jgi:hypothetical protein
MKIIEGISWPWAKILKTKAGVASNGGENYRIMKRMWRRNKRVAAWRHVESAKAGVMSAMAWRHPGVST